MAMPTLPSNIIHVNAKGGWVLPLMQRTSAAQCVASALELCSCKACEIGKINLGK
jgi:hypothetical protein